jgi:hypothetical protein
MKSNRCICKISAVLLSLVPAVSAGLFQLLFLDREQCLSVAPAEMLHRHGFSYYELRAHDEPISEIRGRTGRDQS